MTNPLFGIILVSYPARWCAGVGAVGGLHIKKTFEHLRHPDFIDLTETQNLPVFLPGTVNI